MSVIKISMKLWVTDVHFKSECTSESLYKLIPHQKCCSLVQMFIIKNICNFDYYFHITASFVDWICCVVGWIPQTTYILNGGLCANCATILSKVDNRNKNTKTILKLRIALILGLTETLHVFVIQSYANWRSAANNRIGLKFWLKWVWWEFDRII